MPTIEPGDREEMLLAGILNGDAETNIEPATRKETLLKAILEKGGGTEPVIVTLDNNTADKTNGEILELLNAGVPVYIRFDYTQNLVVEMQVTCRFKTGQFIGLMAMCVNATDDILGVAYADGGLDDNGWTIQGYTLSRAF